MTSGAPDPEVEDIARSLVLAVLADVRPRTVVEVLIDGYAGRRIDQELGTSSSPTSGTC
jgi:hypothetical protein